MFNHVGTVQSQFQQCHTADGGQRNDFAMIFAPPKVIEPTIPARMIKTHLLV